MFFREFPKTLYSFDFKNDSPTVIANIFSRFKIRSSVLNNTVAFYKYQLQEGDTPEIVAYQQYGDASYHWVICMVNDLIDPHFDFPLPTDALERKIIKQYGYSTIANAYSEIHHYELEQEKTYSEVNGLTKTTTENHIVTLNQYDYTSNTLILNNVNTPTTEVYTFRSNNADPNTAVTSTLTIKSSYKAVYVYNYETEVNDNKRQIKLLKQSYIQPLINELGTVLNG